MHSANIEIASSCPTFKNKIKKKKNNQANIYHKCFAAPLGKDGINLVLQMSVMFCDVLTIERYSASMGMITLWKCQAEGAPHLLCLY